MGRVKNLEKIAKTVLRSFPLAKTARPTLLDILNVDLVAQGLLSCYPFYPQTIHFTPKDPILFWLLSIGIIVRKL